MSIPAQNPVPLQRHRGPHLGALAIAFTVLFCAGLYPVTWFGGRPFFPGPWAPASEIAAFFQQRPTAALICAFLQFGSAIPLGIFTATAVSRLEFFGFRVAGPRIAQFGGFATAFMMMVNAGVLWSMVHPVVAQDTTLTVALYYLGFLIGGPAYSVSFGLLAAGLSVPLFFRRDVPRWIPIFGVAVGLIGELSWLNIVLPQAIFLVPLTRFPGFVWLIAVGFALPSTLKRKPEAEPRLTKV